MATTEKSIDVNVPVSTAYNQWTQFEDFPKFMEGITEVRQIDNTHLHWVAEIAGKKSRAAPVASGVTAMVGSIATSLGGEALGRFARGLLGGLLR